MKRLFYILLILCLPSLVFATNYYIKDNGSDGNTGLSDAQAWDSISCIETSGGDSSCGGTTTINDGDDFYFKQDDTWTITATYGYQIRHEGVSTSNRAIIGCYEDTGDFDCSGSRPIIQNSTSGGWVFETEKSGGNAYMHFKDLDLRNTNGTWQNTNGTALTTDNDGRNNDQGYWIVENLRFYHFGHYTLNLGNMGDWNIIVDNEFVENGNNVYIGAENHGGPDYMYIARNTCTDVAGYNGTDGLCTHIKHTQYTIIEDNTTTNGYRGVYIMDADDDGYSNNHNVIRNNFSYGSYGASITIANQLRAGDVTSTGNLIYGNIITESGSGKVRGAIQIGSVAPATGSNSAFNNTIYAPVEGGLEARWGADNANFFNNIVVQDGRTEGTDYLFNFNASGESIGSNFLVDYNLYWTSSGDPSSYDLWKDLAGNSENWTEWNASGWDTNSHVTDPHFTNPGANYFSLTSSSTEAIDGGIFITHVTEAVTSATITVDKQYRLHGNFGLEDADGSAVDGMLVSFYDDGNIQDVEITAVNYTTGVVTLDQSITVIYNGTYPDDPTYTTQVALRFVGAAPDIGALEYDLAISGVSPSDNATAQLTTTVVSWTNPTGTTETKRYFDTTDGSTLVGSGSIATSYDPPGDLVVDTEYFWRVDIVHAGGTETGMVYSFTTAPGPPPDPGPNDGAVSTINGKHFRFSSGGNRIVSP